MGLAAHEQHEEAEAGDAVDALLGGYWRFHVLGAFVRLRVPDLLAEGPTTAAEVSDMLGAVRPDVVDTFLRCASAEGLLDRSSDGWYSANVVTAALCRNGSHATLALMLTAPGACRPMEVLDQVVRHGRSRADLVFDGDDLWTYYRRTPHEAAWFSDWMQEFTEPVVDSVLDRYAFTGHRRVVDIGGGNGTLLHRVLAAHPDATGVLFDRPEVVSRAGAVFKRLGLADRVELVGGDFFEAIPPGGDLYLLKSVLCDWDDASCVRLLSRCREAAGPGVPIVVVDWVRGDGDSPVHDTISLQRLALNGGEIRTFGHFRGLFEAAGLELAVLDRPTPGTTHEWEPATIMEVVDASPWR